MARRHRQHAKRPFDFAQGKQCATQTCCSTMSILLIGNSGHIVSLLTKPHRITPTPLDYYAIEELLTDNERAVRNRARRFVLEEAIPEIVPCHRAGKLAEHLTPRMGALGFYAPYLKEHGCAPPLTHHRR